MLPFPPRPRGMHAKTYDRLRRQAHEAEGLFVVHAVAHSNRLLNQLGKCLGV